MRRSLHSISKALLLGAAYVVGGLPAPAAAQRIGMSGETALAMAAHMIEKGQLDAAEDVLKTLSGGNPETLDMRVVDKLAAKIAYKRGDADRAITLLEGLLTYDEGDVKTRFDLAQVLLAEEKGRAARKHFVAILKTNPSDEDERVIRQYLQIIEDRREVRFSFRASAAPSTNVNSATSDEVFNAFGFLPSRLDDDARAQSGLGLSWSLGGRYTPKFNQRLRGHFVARGQMTDYTNEKFDQALGGGEAGVRLPQTSQHGADITIAATYDHQFFAGDPYSTTAGARVNILKPLSQKFAVQTELSAGQITYKDRPDLDGPFYALNSQLIYAPKRSLQFTFGTSFAREDAEFGAAANDQYGVSTSVSWAAPYKLQLGLAPGFSLRNFDEVAALYGVLREDERFDLSARLGKRDWTIGGFYPSLIYRYTDNNSTVSLFTYNRHGVDLGFARLF